MSRIEAPSARLRCAVFWTGGHMCLQGLTGHAGDHACANAQCPSPHDVATPAVWGADAGELRRGAIPVGGGDLAPSRGLAGRNAS